MIASIGSNTCPILEFSGFAKSPGPSAFFYKWTAGLLADFMAIKKASEVGSLIIVIKLKKILLSAAILAHFVV